MPHLVPELTVSDLDASLAFWRDLVGFRIAYERPEEGFASLALDGISVMLEEAGRAARTWETGPLEKPYGRGINFEFTLEAIEPVLTRLRAGGWPLFLEPERKRYRVGAALVEVRQFLVQDPDGYLLRFAEEVGSERP